MNRDILSVYLEVNIWNICKIMKYYILISLSCNFLALRRNNFLRLCTLRSENCKSQLIDKNKFC